MRPLHQRHRRRHRCTLQLRALPFAIPRLEDTGRPAETAFRSKPTLAALCCVLPQARFGAAEHYDLLPVDHASRFTSPFRPSNASMLAYSFQCFTVPDRHRSTLLMGATDMQSLSVWAQIVAWRSVNLILDHGNVPDIRPATPYLYPGANPRGTREDY